MKYLQVIKMSLAFFLAMMIAQAFQLSYVASAGIVALLTIQNTRKETFQICLKRVLSFCISLLCAFFVFLVLGYSAFSFAIFLMFFIAISYYGHLEDGIAMNAVITTHYLIENSMSQEWIINEFMIFMIGILIGILINLYMPSQMKSIQKSLNEIDQNIKEILNRLSLCLLKKQKTGSLYPVFDDIFKQIEVMSKQTYQEMNNRLLNDTRYEFQYLVMRKEQLSILYDIYGFIVDIDFVGDQAKYLSQFLNEISKEYHENNDALYLKEQLASVKQHYRQEQLPITRDEFENRAKLYTILCYLEKFVDLKYKFMLS